MRIRYFQFCLLGFACLNLAGLQADEAPPLTYTSEDFKIASKKIIVVLLDERTDEAFGDYYESGKHLNKLSALHERLAKTGTRAVGYDISMYFPDSDVLASKREAFLQTLQSQETPAFVGYIFQSEAKKLLKELSASDKVQPGHCRAYPESDSEAFHHDRVSFELGRGFSLLIEQLFRTGEDHRNTKHEIDLKVAAPPNETFVATYELNELLRFSDDELKEVFDEKYVLVGSGYEEIDNPQTSNGRKINGVFFHAAALASLLARPPEASTSSMELGEAPSLTPGN